jgi:high affinity sulfate transporter 1
MTLPPDELPLPHRSALQRWIPLWPLLRGYKRAWLAKDVFAGVALSAVLVPVGLSYAEVAGLPVMAGLYATIGALIGYALFGPSRILVLGPDSALAALIAATVVPLAHGDAAQTVALSSTLAIMAGALCVLLGLAKLGFVTDLLSHPIRLGFLNGIAVTLIASELPRLLGFADSHGSVIESVTRAARGLISGDTQWVSAAIGLSCIATILLLRRYAPRVPGVLIAILAAGLAGWWLHRERVAFSPVMHALSPGWTPPRFPTLSLDSFRSLAGGAVAIALVSIADTSILSRVFARAGAGEGDRDQQLLGLGAANLLAGALSGCPVSSSASRTPVAQAAGAQTQVANLVAAASTALLVLVAPSLMAYVPDAVLAAIVICAALGIVELRQVARLFRIHRSEFLVSTLCLTGVILLGALPGIFMAMALALASFVWRAWHPYDAVLGQVAGRRGYHDVSRHPDAKQFSGLLLFRWDAPLFFANAEIFAEHVSRAIAQARAPVTCVVIAAEPVTDIDVTAADVLAGLRQALHKDGVRLWFAEMKGPAKDRLRRYRLYDSLGGDDCFFATVGEAVDRFRALRPLKSEQS